MDGSLVVLLYLQAHITSPNVELSQAALQALGFCVYHSRVVSDVPGMFIYFCCNFTHNYH